MLYHYTDYIALKGILGDTELRLNNVLNMNDDAEMQFYMDGICDAVLQRLKDSNLQERMQEVQILFNNELEEVFNYSSYAACFSYFKDDAAQWERYSQNGQGVCISFDEVMLRRIADNTNGIVQLKNVQYNKDFLSLEITDRLYELVAGAERLSDCIEKFEGLMREAWLTSAAFKHPSFKNENEVRLMITPSLLNYFSVTPEYQITSGKIKKYYPLNLEKMCNKAGIQIQDLVKEVRIGPTSLQSEAILRDYLRDLGYIHLAEAVFVSECPLRKTE